jgi:hypothetical protein
VSPKWSLSFRFPHQNPVYATPLPHTRCMPRPSHSSWFYHPKNIGWGAEVIILWLIIINVSDETSGVQVNDVRTNKTPSQTGQWHT